MNYTRRIKLASIPRGMPADSDFLLEEIEMPKCPENGVLLRTAWLSVDPYIRGRLAGKKTYVDPILVGNVMESSCVGQVVESKSPNFQNGDWVTGFWGWQEYVTPDLRTLQKLNPDEAPVSTAIGVLGMPGMTAYFGLTELCSPKPSETVFVSGAAGAVGSAVGQIAKILGCRVVGTAGSKAKLDYLESIGFDAAFDYHTERPYSDMISEICPQGIDCYFDNVGGKLSDEVIKQMNLRGRVAVCGQISQYNEDPSADLGPRPYIQMIIRQLRFEGFIVSRWASRFPEGRKQMLSWWKEGKLSYQETKYAGLDRAVEAFIGLFHGENTGKAIVKL